MDMELKWIVEPESTELGKICIIVFTPCDDRTCSFCWEKSCYIALDI